MKSYYISLKEPFCSWIEELTDLSNMTSRKNITEAELIQKLVIRVFIYTIDEIAKEK